MSGSNVTYVYNTPCPQSSFPGSDSTCVQSVNQYVYDPCNCDPGSWCGCASTEPANCIPSNDTAVWAGKFTTVNEDGDTIVLTGAAGDLSQYVECPDTTYCPGLDDTASCPDMCQPGSYCPDGALQLDCPSGKYCPVGSVEPRDCPPMMACAEGGLEIFRSWPAFLLVFFAVIILYSSLLSFKKRVIRSEMHQREEALKNLSAKDASPPDSSKDEHQEIPLTLDLDFEDLQLTLPDGGPTIMQGVSGSINHGQITAVMGPSGAGKSTFLSILSGKAARTGGSLRVNGVESELAQYRRVIGFVPQEDTMLRELSISEIIYHSALMRLPSSWSRERKLRKADDTIDLLELTRVRDSIIGDELTRGISGGQRKRVNIGIEMVMEPSLLCLDEPTSGLDSTSSMSVLRVLKELAHSGVNVIAVLHQPKYEIFELFDSVLLLGVGGKTVYLGPATGLPSYFEPRGFPCPIRSNPADYYMDVIAGIVPRNGRDDFDKAELFALWAEAQENPKRKGAPSGLTDVNLDAESKSEAKKLGECAVERPLVKYLLSWKRWAIDISEHLGRNTGVDADEIRTVPGFGGQFTLCFKRAILQRIRDPSVTLSALLMEALAGALLGIANGAIDNMYEGVPVAAQDSPTVGAWIATNIQLTDLIPSTWSNLSLGIVLVSIVGVDIFGAETSNFFRESATGLRVSAYWLAKTVEAFMWIPVFSLVFCSISYGIAPLLLPFAKFWLICWMAHVGFYALGMISSVLYAPKNRGIICLVTGLVFSMAFTGVVVNYGDSGAKLIFWLFWNFWCAQTFSSAMYSEYNPPYNTEVMNDVNSVYGTVYGHGYDLQSSFGRNIGLAALTACAMHLLVLWFLKTYNYKKQR